MAYRTNHDNVRLRNCLRCMLTVLSFNLAFAVCVHAATTASVKNSSYVSAQGERVLRIEMELNEPIATSWRAFTTEAMAKRWMAPTIQIDLKTGGTVKTRYDHDGKIGDEGTIVLGIINCLDQRLITYKVNLNESFPPQLHAEDRNLQEIIEFVPVGPRRTRIVSSMVGWGAGDEWDKAYKFFAVGNKWTYEQLVKMFSNERK